MNKNYLLALVLLVGGVIGIIYSWPVFLLILFLILAAVLAWFYLPVILVFLPAVLPFLPAVNPTSDIDLAASRLLIVFLAGVGSLYIVYKKKSWFNLSTPTVLILFFLAWSLFSGLLADDPGRFIRKYLVFLTIFPLYFLLLAFLKKESHWEKLFSYWSLGAFLISLVGLSQFMVQFIIGSESFIVYWGKYVAPILYGANAGEVVASNPSWLVGIGEVDILRALSVFPDPHMLAFYLGMSLPLQVVYILKRKSKWLWILPITSLVILLLTFSRGSYVGLVGAAAWILFSLLRKGVRNFFIYRIVVLLAFFTFIIFSVSPIRDRFTSILDFNEGSNKGRLEIWNEAAELIKYNPLLGVGLGNYSNFVRPEADYREPIYAHNTYLDFASEVGLPGVVVWVLLLFWGISPLWRGSVVLGERGVLGYNLAAALGIFWFSLHSIFETPVFSPQILPLILTLIAYRVYFQETRNKRQEIRNNRQ